MPKRPRQKPSAPQPTAEDLPPPGRAADDPLPEPQRSDAGVQPPVTDTGLPVEEQVRKEWDPKKSGGLPTPLQVRRR